MPLQDKKKNWNGKEKSRKDMFFREKKMFAKW